nr:putative ribonuclease H-like domain-containing protein [Tanacetum cinerariifolium]
AARHQVTPKTSNLLSVKRIFKYLTAYPKLVLWYPRDSLFDLEAFSDSDYAAERQELLEHELKQNINAEQVYLDSLLAQRVAEEQDRESMASAIQATQRQA